MARTRLHWRVIRQLTPSALLCKKSTSPEVLSRFYCSLVDGLGSPLDFILTQGQAHDLEEADTLLLNMAAETLLADKAFDADQRVIEPLLARGKSGVIPPKSNRKVQRDCDQDAYKARHLIDNFCCKLKQYRAVAARYDKTARISSSQSTSRLLSSGSMEDRP